MKKSTILKKLLLERNALVVPGAHDVISAKLIEKFGFKAIQVSGFGLSASLLGLPDMGFLSFFEVLTLTRNIVNAVNIPVMADADTGYGNAVNAMRVTEEFIKIGAAGMNIEDQVFPKRCGHLEGKEIIPLEEMVLKIKACARVRDELDPDFVINARTDAIAVAGIEEAIRRGNAYAEAGADIIFVEAPRSLEEVERAVKEIHAPISINLFDLAGSGKTPFIPLEKLKELKVARVSVPVGLLFAAIKGMELYLHSIQENTPVEERKKLLIDFDHFKEIVNFQEFRKLEREFLPKK